MAKSTEAVLTSIKELIPKEDFKHLEGIVKEKVISLGTDEAFALRDDKGEIRAFRQKLTLSQAEGTLIQPVPNGPFVISAQGYERWAESAGACLIFPKEVLVGNTWQPNPFVERDPDNKRILCVHARAVAFRFSSKGIPQVSDWSHIFDTPSYRLIDLLAKAKKTPQAFKLLPNGLKPDEDDGTWAQYTFDGSTKLWVNTAHEEALQWFSQILNREKKAIDFAQTFAKRNALKHLSGLQRAPANVWEMSVLCWRPTGGNIVKWDATQYIQLQEKVGTLIQGTGEDFEAQVTKQIESTEGKESISDDQHLDEAEIAAEEQAPIDIESKNETTEQAPPKEPKSKIIKSLISTKNIFPEEMDSFCKETKVDIDGIIEAEDEEAAKMVNDEFSRYMDKQYTA